MLRPTRFACILAGFALTALTACNTDSAPTDPALSIQATCTRSVTVSEVDFSVPHNTTNHAAIFHVTNTSGTSNTATVSCTTTGTLTCSGSNPSVTLAPGQGTSVVLHYNAGAVNASNTIKATSCNGSATAKVRVI